MYFPTAATGDKITPDLQGVLCKVYEIPGVGCEAEPALRRTLSPFAFRVISSDLVLMCWSEK